LLENGFQVKYTHPNLLFIYWGHYVPSHIRMEIKKKSGINIDGFGKEIIKNETKKEEEIPSNLIISKIGAPIKPKKETNFASINEYKPTGNLVYTNDMFSSMNKKIENSK